MHVRARPIACLVLAAVALGATLAAAPAQATPSLSGPTGMIVVPTAVTLGKNEVDLALDEYPVKLDGGGSFTFTNIRAEVGLIDRPDSGLEVGFIKPSASAISVTDAYIFGKYRIPGLLPGGALAVGGTISTDKHNYTSAYMVGSSAIAKNITLNYGGGVNVYGDPMGFSFFGGRTSAMRADPAFALFGTEFDWRRFKISIEYNGSYVSYGVDYFPDSFFSLQAFKLGRGDYERLLGATNELGLGATVRF